MLKHPMDQMASKALGKFSPFDGNNTGQPQKNAGECGKTREAPGTTASSHECYVSSGIGYGHVPHEKHDDGSLFSDLIER